MKLFFAKMNCMLLIFVIFFSSVSTNANENNISNNNDIEDLVYSDADNELNKFYEKEGQKNKDLDNFISDSDKGQINLIETNQSISKPSKKPAKAKKPVTKAAKGKIIKKKVSKPKKAYPPAKLISQYNPYYPKKKSVIIENTKSSYCKYKNGFLHLVKNSSKLGAIPLTIRTIPVYVTLTMTELKLQMGLPLKTLFNTVKVGNILKVTKKFKNAFCFEIIEDEVIEKSLAKSPITLCAGNFNIMMDWVKALQEFKDCMYNIDSRNTGSRTLVDFHRINKLIKVVKPSTTKKPKAFNPLYYEQGASVSRINRGTSKDEYVMKRQLEKIVGLLEKGQINKQTVNRKMKTQLKNAEKIEYDIRKKQDMINKIIRQREMKEKEKEEKIKTQVQKKREVQLLKAVKSRILQYKVCFYFLIK